MSERHTVGRYGGMLCAAMFGPAAALLHTALTADPTATAPIYYVSKVALAALALVWLRGVAKLPIRLPRPQPAGLITGVAIAAPACAAVIGP